MADKWNMSTKHRWNDNDKEKPKKAYCTKTCLNAISKATNSAWLTWDRLQASVLRGRRRIARWRELRLNGDLKKSLKREGVGGEGGRRGVTEQQRMQMCYQTKFRATTSLMRLLDVNEFQLVSFSV